VYKPYIDGGKFLPAQHKGETDDQVTAAGNGRADTDAENDDDGDDDGGSGGGGGDGGGVMIVMVMMMVMMVVVAVYSSGRCFIETSQY